MFFDEGECPSGAPSEPDWLTTARDSVISEVRTRTWAADRFKAIRERKFLTQRELYVRQPPCDRCFDGFSLRARASTLGNAGPFRLSPGRLRTVVVMSCYRGAHVVSHD